MRTVSSVTTFSGELIGKPWSRWRNLKIILISQTFQGTAASPFVPTLNGEEDTSNFDEEFTDGPLEQTKIKLNKMMKGRCEDEFLGFSFAAD